MSAETILWDFIELMITEMINFLAKNDNKLDEMLMRCVSFLLISDCNYNIVSYISVACVDQVNPKFFPSRP